MGEKETKQDSLEKLIKTAYKEGVAKDQLERFLQYGYVPLPWQLKFHALARKCDEDNQPVRLGAGGARGPGKSYCVFAQTTLDDCQRIEGLKALFLRQTGKSASESFDDLILSILHGKVQYKYTQGILRFPNGSRILLGGFETERDIDKYIGIQYDLIAVEELNQLTEGRILKLLGSMRTSKENWRPRLYGSFNPGNIGHLFVKKWFVDPYFQGKSKESAFVPATYKQNPYLNKEYIDYLEGLTGTLGKAWREGNFDIFEGQFFGEWNNNYHTCQPFNIPEEWVKFRAYDHGREAPACCLWCAVDQDGRVWVYREYYEAGKNVDQIAQEINRLSGQEKYKWSVADSAIFAKQGMVDKWGGETIAQNFLRHGIQFIPASKRRVDGWNLMHQYLFWNELQRPKLIFFSTCHNAIRTIPALIHDTTESKLEDVDTLSEDHCLVGDTIVHTTQGDFKIIDLVGKEGFLYTPFGIHKFYGVRKTREKVKVYKVLFNKNREITATSDHLILTDNGWKMLKSLKVGDSVICSRLFDVIQWGIWKLKSYLQQFKSLITRDIICAVNIFREMVLGCIDLFGNIITGKYQTNFISIIKMEIGQIISLRTWNYYQNTTTFQSIQKRQLQSQTQGNGLRKQELKQSNGTNQKKEENGIVNTLKKLLKIGNGLLNIVQYVVRNIRHRFNLVVNQCFAILIVKCGHLIAVEKISLFGIEDVFNLEVEKVHCFKVNGGLVVHNCGDAIRYMLMSLKEAQAEPAMTELEKKLQSWKEQTEGFNSDFYEGKQYQLEDY